MDDFDRRILEAPILIVDDRESNVLLLENLLRQRGYTRVDATQNPFEVVPRFTEQEHALILLDMQMPGLDGLGVLARLRAASTAPFLPVLVITAQTDADLRVRALQAGARDYVTKPFVVPELAQRIRNLLEVELAYRDRARQAQWLEQKVLERTRELEETQFEILRRLARAGEYRDNETGHHVLRVAHSSKLLAIAAGLDEPTAAMIEHASPMHDVGKIGIPDDILLKPGRLEGDDLAWMRRHVEIGGGILGGHNAPIMTMAHRIALGHHERWDGRGYPRGLAGEDIPIEARIVAVCDVFDALTSARPYKAAWSIDEAVGYVKREAGGHFDPRLVDAFLTVLPAILEFRTRFAD